MGKIGFRINSGVKLETAQIRNKALKMSTTYKKVDKGIIFGIKSIDQFVKEEKEIADVIKLYKQLLYKDSKDIDKMVDEMLSLDIHIGRGWLKPIRIKPIGIGTKDSIMTFRNTMLK